MIVCFLLKWKLLGLTTLEVPNMQFIISTGLDDVCKYVVKNDCFCAKSSQTVNLIIAL